MANSGFIRNLNKNLSSQPRWFVVLMLIAVGLRLAVGFSTEGYYHPDEFNSYVEPAYNWAFPNQEFRLDTSDVEAYRSFFIQSWHFLIIKAFTQFVPYDASSIVKVFHIFMAIISLSVLIWLYKIVRCYESPEVARWATLLAAFWYYFIYFSPHLLSENYSLLGIMPGFYLLARYDSQSRPLKDAMWLHPIFMFGWVMALTCQLRLQAGFLCVPVFVLLALRRDLRSCGYLILSFFSVFGLFGCLEWFYKGTIFGTLKAYFDITFGQHADMLKNTDHWYGLLRALNTQISEWFFPVVVLGALWAGFRRAAMVASAVFGFIAIHSLFPHKEVRFIFPVQPMLLALAVMGFALWWRACQSQLGRRSLFGFLALLIGTAQWMRGRSVSYTGGLAGQAFRVVQEVRKRNDISGLTVVGKGHCLGQFSFHRSLPYRVVKYSRDLLESRNLVSAPQSQDVYLYDSQDENDVTQWLEQHGQRYQYIASHQRIKALRVE